MYEIDIGTMAFDILQESYGQDKGTDSEQGQQGNGKYFIAIQRKTDKHGRYRNYNDVQHGLIKRAPWLVFLEEQSTYHKDSCQIAPA